MRTPVVAPAVTLTTAAALPASDTRLEGRLPSGATYLMDIPEDWNGTVLPYSHGYRAADWPNPPQNPPDSGTRDGPWTRATRSSAPPTPRPDGP